MNKLENKVLKMLLDGDDLVLVSLRKQLNLISVASREMSGSGSFTNFLISQDYQPNSIISGMTFKFGDVYAEITGLQFGAGFLLYIQDGLIKMLEAYSFEEPWPTDINHFKLSYLNGERNFKKLKSNWLS